MHQILEFVPKSKPVRSEDLFKLWKLIYSSSKICVLTGAGVSTESGIPDYRSEGVGLYARSNRKPMLYKEFCENEHVRKWYWARNYVGWQRFSSSQPNNTHKILKKLEDEKRVQCIITQNVDSLHKKAGSLNVIELHGTAFRVICMTCDYQVPRTVFQNILRELNPTINTDSFVRRPDGDALIAQEQIDRFIIPSCEDCKGILKPDITFFGDNVPRSIVELAKTEVENCDLLVIAGTTLSAFSAYRIVLQALDMKKPIAILNIGKTRADSYANIKVQARCGEVFTKLYSLKEEYIDHVD